MATTVSEGMTPVMKDIANEYIRKSKMTNNAEQALEDLNNIPPFMGKQSQEACTKFINEHGETLRQALTRTAQLEEACRELYAVVERYFDNDDWDINGFYEQAKQTLQKHKDIGGVE